jgi:predicted HicB family RNase H-like nuclease
MNAHSYNITVRQVEEDGERLFEARIREFPDVLEFGDTAAEAYELAIDTIETTAEAFKEMDRKMPAPATFEDDYSGRVTLRVPKRLHRALAQHAEDESISLNQYLVSVLSYHAGTQFVDRDQSAKPWRPVDKVKARTERKHTPNLKVISSNRSTLAEGWQKTG